MKRTIFVFTTVLAVGFLAVSCSKYSAVNKELDAINDDASR